MMSHIIEKINVYKRFIDMRLETRCVRINDLLKNDMYRDIMFSMMSHEIIGLEKNERMIIEKMRCITFFLNYSRHSILLEPILWADLIWGVLYCASPEPLITFVWIIELHLE